MNFAQVRMRRYRRERRGRRERKADGSMARTSLTDTKKGHPNPEARTEISPSSARIAVSFGVVGAAVVALKLHKFFMLDGAWISSGTVAVITEDLAVIVAVFGLWSMAWAALFRALECAGCRYEHGSAAAATTVAAAGGAGSLMTRFSEVFRQTPVRAIFLWIAVCVHWLALLALASGIVVCVAVEHIYFWSTRSLLDADALLVASKSFRPILFIVLSVEGKHMATLALTLAMVLVALGFVACKLRRAAGRMRERRELSGLYRYWKALSWLFRLVGAGAGAVTTPAVLAACASFIVVGALILQGNRHGDYRVKLLRRNCFVGVALDLRNTPPAGGGDSWASAVAEAWSSRVVGGYGPESRAPGSGAQNEQASRGRDGGVVGLTRPNIVIVVLESTTGTLVTPSNHAGVSPWAAELARRGMSSSSFYSAMPNTNKAMFQVMCGMTPSLETSWVEFDRPDVLKAVCLPGLLRSKLGYESLFLTGSMVGGLGCLDFDEAVGYAGMKEQGGRKGFKKRLINEKFSFKHGTFGKVNYLGYDDHVVLDRSVSFLLGKDGNKSGGEMTKKTKKSKKTKKDASQGKGKSRDKEKGAVKAEEAEGGVGGGKLLTILTVGPHHFHDVPEDFKPEDLRQSAGDTVWGTKGPLHDKYLAALRYQDLFLERLYGKLDETGLSDNTYVVIVGDHGEAFEEHGYNKHGNNVYQEGILVPFFLTGPSADPRITPGATLDRVGMHADIAPTVLDLLGLWVDGDKATTSRDERENSQLFSPPSSSSESQRDPPRQDEEEAQEPRKNNLRLGQQTKKDGEKEMEGNERRGSNPGQQVAKARDDAVRAGVVAAGGSGIVGDSLIKPDERGCAVGANHYGGKTIAVVAGDWKGLFLYRWGRHGDVTQAEVVSVQLFDLSSDPWETRNLLKEGGAGGCCPMNDLPYSAPAGQSPVSASCRLAARIAVPPLRRMEGDDEEEEEEEVVTAKETAAANEKTYREACCHLQRAAMAFAGDNLRFFGRLG